MQFGCAGSALAIKRQAVVGGGIPLTAKSGARDLPSAEALRPGILRKSIRRSFRCQQPERVILSGWASRSTLMSSSRSATLSLAATRSTQEGYYLGIDFGTSGARACAVDGDGSVVAQSRRDYDSCRDWGATWEDALWGLIAELPAEVAAAVRAVAVDGTSATTMLIDEVDGALLAPAKLYDEAQDATVTAIVKAMAPPQHTTTAPTSALCKVVAWQHEGLLQRLQEEGRKPRVLHQADWIAYKLHGCRLLSFSIHPSRLCLSLGRH
mmetsp:Transcript_4550/g.8285  ORF Transcript_4550/g.8285 Transcript_4550/m.8285 type:complete len:267 (-) Transcript_4550:808-1608(-)